MNYDTIVQTKSKTKINKKVKIGEIMLSFAIFFVMFAILTNPTLYAKSITDGLKLFVVAVLPGLLPFMFLNKILANLKFEHLTNIFNKPAKKLFGLDGYAMYGYFISILSGYPVGAKIVSELYNQNKISEKDILKTSLLCSTSGPIFIVGTVGALMLQNKEIGIFLYFINILSALLSVILINLFERFKKAKSSKNKNDKKVKIDNKNDNRNDDRNDGKNNRTDLQKTKIHDNQLSCHAHHLNQSIFKLFTRSASDTASSLLIVAFYIAFFYLLIDLLNNFKVLQFLSSLLNIFFKNSDISTATTSGIVEMTRGINLLSFLKNSTSLALISFLLSFGGFSIIFQSLSFLSDTPIKASKFMLGKLFQGTLSFTLTILFAPLIA
ncbi:MAG: hypothetical protein IJS74_03345 [Clostridia bacterium]|nr:hypothetical protein [Clostridia bacterium]